MESNFLWWRKRRGEHSWAELKSPGCESVLGAAQPGAVPQPEVTRPDLCRGSVWMQMDSGRSEQTCPFWESCLVLTYVDIYLSLWANQIRGSPNLQIKNVWEISQIGKKNLYTSQNNSPLVSFKSLTSHNCIMYGVTISEDILLWNRFIRKQRSL